MIRLHVITPVVCSLPRVAVEFGALIDGSVELSAEVLTTGPDCIETEADEARAIPEVIARAIVAEQQGANAIVVDCFGDPGVAASRAAVSIPVVGPGEASMHLAVTLGRRFGVVTVLDSVFDMLARMAIRYGVADRMAPPRAIGIPVLELEQDLERVTRELAREAIEAVRQDGIDVVVLGCTGMLGCAAEVSRALQEHYGEYIPVIDPLPAAAAIAITSARMGVSHRRRSFASLRG